VDRLQRREALAALGAHRARDRQHVVPQQLALRRTHHPVEHLVVLAGRDVAELAALLLGDMAEHVERLDPQVGPRRRRDDRLQARVGQGRHERGDAALGLDDVGRAQEHLVADDGDRRAQRRLGQVPTKPPIAMYSSRSARTLVMSAICVGGISAMTRLARRGSSCTARSVRNGVGSFAATSTARDGSSRPVSRAHSNGPKARSPISAASFVKISQAAVATRCSIWQSASNIVTVTCSRRSRISCASTPRR